MLLQVITNHNHSTYKPEPEEKQNLLLTKFQMKVNEMLGVKPRYTMLPQIRFLFFFFFSNKEVQGSTGLLPVSQELNVLCMSWEITKLGANWMKITSGTVQSITANGFLTSHGFAAIF